jgi:hypothetical protein
MIMIFFFLLILKVGKFVMAHACKPSYSGGGDRRIVISGQSLAKLARPFLKSKLGMVV